MPKDFPVDVGLVYEGERVRKSNMFIDLGGPKTIAAEVMRIAELNELNGDDVKVIGPDIPQMKEGSAYPFGIFIRVAGEKLEEDLEGVFERRIHEFCNYIQGFMHLNSRDTIWCRMSKEAVKKGLTIKHVGIALIELFKNEWDIIQKMHVTFYTDEAEVKEFVQEARKIYEKRDSRLRGLKDEDVDVFYGCALCQSFAPQHLCTITPSRTSSCGSISWFEGRAAAKIDPKGPIFEISKGKLLDPVKGEYSGANEVTAKRSSGTVQRVYLHSIFEHPHTSCGCFEAIGFYIPEVDGIGVVSRDFHGLTPFGIPFSTMAGQVGGGMQSDGFVGIAIDYLRSPKFLQADGGYERLVWMPKALKERVYSDLPESIRDKIPTEEDAPDTESLKKALEAKGHPIVARWSEETKAPAEAGGAVETAPQPAAALPEFSIPLGGMPITGAGEITITFKNAKIYAERVIISKSNKK